MPILQGKYPARSARSYRPAAQAFWNLRRRQRPQSRRLRMAKQHLRTQMPHRRDNTEDRGVRRNLIPFSDRKAIIYRI